MHDHKIVACGAQQTFFVFVEHCTTPTALTANSHCQGRHQKCITGVEIGQISSNVNLRPSLEVLDGDVATCYCIWRAQGPDFQKILGKILSLA